MQGEVEEDGSGRSSSTKDQIPSMAGPPDTRCFGPDRDQEPTCLTGSSGPVGVYATACRIRPDRGGHGGDLADPLRPSARSLPNQWRWCLASHRMPGSQILLASSLFNSVPLLCLLRSRRSFQLSRFAVPLLVYPKLACARPKKMGEKERKKIKSEGHRKQRSRVVTRSAVKQCLLSDSRPD